MTIVTPKDAYALALIAQRPNESRELVEKLSANAKPIGDALIGEASGSGEIAEIVRQLREWAKTAEPKPQEILSPA
jgi:hypothetical protein